MKLPVFIGPILPIFGIFMLACNNTGMAQQPASPPQTNISPKDCIQKIIAADDSLGKVRNHACETISLAETIRNYADALQRLDFSTCPAAFTAAFKKHRQAWLDMIPLMEKYPDLRGEMHVLFEGLEKGEDADTFKPLLKAVWDTWSEIDVLMRD